MTNGQELANMKKMYSQIQAPGTDEFGQRRQENQPWQTAGFLHSSCAGGNTGRAKEESCADTEEMLRGQEKLNWYGNRILFQRDSEHSAATFR